MKPKVIKTGRDYQAALAHVESLMDKSSQGPAASLFSLLPTGRGRPAAGCFGL